MGRQEKIEAAVARAIEAIDRAITEGQFDGDPFMFVAGFVAKDVPDVTMDEVRSAVDGRADAVARDQAILEAIERIGNRHDAKPNETLGELLAVALIFPFGT